jgi:hypothetical protein
VEDSGYVLVIPGVLERFMGIHDARHQLARRTRGEGGEMLKSASTWSAPVSWAEVIQRAGGRRRWHGVRRLRAQVRRRRVTRWLLREGLSYGCRVR